MLQKIELTEAVAAAQMAITVSEKKIFALIEDCARGLAHNQWPLNLLTLYSNLIMAFS